jgi:hypothetical protein
MSLKISCLINVFPIGKTFPIDDQKKEFDLHKRFCEEKSFKFTLLEENMAEIAIIILIILATLQQIGRFQ